MSSVFRVLLYRCAMVLAQAEAMVGSSDGRSLPVQLKEIRIWVSFGCGIRSSWTDVWFLDLR